MIIFFPVDDPACEHSLEKSEVIMNDFADIKVISAYSINEIIQFDNICKYIDNKVYLKSWNQEKIAEYIAKCSSFKTLIGKYLSSIADSNLEYIYSAVDRWYIENFWEVFERYKVYQRVSKDMFTALLDANNGVLCYVLINKNTTKHYLDIIKEKMLTHPKIAESIIYTIEVNNENNIFILSELKQEEKEQIMENYINSSDANYKYLKLIEKTQNLTLSDKTRLKAKQKAQLIKDEVLSDEKNYMSFRLSVRFVDKQKDAVIENWQDGSPSISYSKEWIVANLDYPTLFNNFIYLFKFVDIQQCRCLFPNRFNDMSVLERHAFMRSKKEYIKGTAFNVVNDLSIMATGGYYKILLNNDIRMENMIEWFFKEYLKDEFKVDSFILDMPSNESTILEKCRNIMPSMEWALKQFSNYVEDRQINHELLNIASAQMKYANIPSLVNRKYVYGVGDDYIRASNLLFSDQNGLSYCTKSGVSYDNLYGRICSMNFQFIDLGEYDQLRMQWLIDNRYVHIKEDGNIDFVDRNIIKVLRELYYKEFISYWHLSEKDRQAVDELVIKGLVEFESKLFSKQESSYFNYILNKAEFINGLDLRNKYLHTQPYSADSENMYELDYMNFLRLFVVTVIKINDDFCIHEIANKIKE